MSELQGTDRAIEAWEYYRSKEHGTLEETFAWQDFIEAVQDVADANDTSWSEAHRHLINTERISRAH